MRNHHQSSITTIKKLKDSTSWAIYNKDENIYSLYSNYAKLKNLLIIYSLKNIYKSLDIL